MEKPDQTESIANFILKQRNALYQLHKETGGTRVDLEMLAYFKLKRFVNFNDLKLFYPHTNVQVIKRSLRKLQRLSCLEILRNGSGNQPTYYSISRSGRSVFQRFTNLIEGHCGDDCSFGVENWSLSSHGYLLSIVTHPSAKNWL